MRLNPELLTGAPSYLNPIKDRELDLRGHQIQAIENLGIVRDQNGAIDFSDNDIRHFGNFPYSPRIRTILLGRNRVSTIATNLGKTLPNLQIVVLNSNAIAELADIDGLRDCSRLEFLATGDNPIERKPHYRHWMIWRLPQVRILDFERVTQKEREKAAELFGTAEAPTPLAAEIMGIHTRTFELDGATDEAHGQKAASHTRLTPDERRRIEEAIRSAKSMAEVNRLESLLLEGRIPTGETV